MTQTALPVSLSGIPSWAIVALDGALATGAIKPDDLDGLRTPGLMALAAEIVTAQLDAFDANTAITAARMVRQRNTRTVAA